MMSRGRLGPPFWGAWQRGAMASAWGWRQQIHHWSIGDGWVGVSGGGGLRWVWSDAGCCRRQHTTESERGVFWGGDSTARAWYHRLEGDVTTRGRFFFTPPPKVKTKGRGWWAQGVGSSQSRQPLFGKSLSSFWLGFQPQKGETLKDDGRSSRSIARGGGERWSCQGIDPSNGPDPVARGRLSSLLRHAGVSEKIFNVFVCHQLVTWLQEGKKTWPFHSSLSEIEPSNRALPWIIYPDGALTTFPLYMVWPLKDEYISLLGTML